MTLQIKLIIAAILAALVAYSYVWTYHQGQMTGQANEVQIQLKIRKENQAEFQEQLQRDLQEARQQYDQQLANEHKKVKAQEDANKILKTLNQALLTALNTPVPDELIGVLNSRIRGFGQSVAGGAKPTSGTNEAVPPTT